MVVPRSCFALFVALSAPFFQTFAQQVPAADPMSVDLIVKLSKEGVSEDVLIAKIKKNGKAFDLNGDELVELKKLGVADSVVKTLLDPTLPYAPPPRPEPPPIPKVVVPPRKYPDDRYASMVPPEVGLYHLDRGTPAQMGIKLFLGQQQGAGLGKVLLKKGTTIAYLIGPFAKTRLGEVAPVFYMRMADGKGIEELLLVSLDHKKDRRELDMGPPAPKPTLKPETIRQFDSLEVGPGLFRLTPSTLAAGEYAFFLIGTAEPPKGNYGKGYDFGIEPPNAE